MSTKRSIKFKERETCNGTGFHLYDDVGFDWDEDDGNACVYLELEGVRAEVIVGQHAATVTVAIPVGIARELGLLPPLDK